MKPVKHKLNETGVGDVVPVELLNRVVETGNQIADAISREHVPGPDEAYIHTSPQFAVATACIDFELSTFWDGAFKERRAWHTGFKSPPKFTTEEKSLSSTDLIAFRLEWEMKDESTMWPSVGLAIFEPESINNTQWKFEQKGSIGILTIAILVRHSIDDWHDFNDPYYEKMRRIYLTIRTTG